jgi:apolipoprotein N-acyltransferase
MVSVCGLFLLLDGASLRDKRARAGFGIAWSWGFGYFLAGMFWVGNAFLVDAEKFALLMPFAVSALPAGLGLFWGLGGAVYARFSRGDASRLLLFVLVFTLADFARGHVLTGLPWNLPAYIWKPGGIVSQSAALVGPYGLSLLTLWVLAAPAVLFSPIDVHGQRRWSFLLPRPTGELSAKLTEGVFAESVAPSERFAPTSPAVAGEDKVHSQAPSAPALFVAASVAIICAAVATYGGLRLHQAGPVAAMAGKGPIIATGQAGFSQKEVWAPENTARVTQTYLDLLNRPEAKSADLIVWPEGAFPYLLLEEPDVLDAIGARLGGRTLLVGAVRRKGATKPDIYRNSLLAFANGPDGLVLEAAYDKFHLVPFGEYLPLRAAFQALGIASLVSYDGEMTPGPAPSLMRLTGLPNADPRICYEIVFPAFNPKATGQAGFILNVSVDAWYGDALGPDQHYAQARARAIETGMPLVRAASGGWSAVVDRYGRPLTQHRFGAGYGIARLPLNAHPTLYARFGDKILVSIVAFLFVFMLIWRKRSVDFTRQVVDETKK